jgi:hypothetical protein
MSSSSLKFGDIVKISPLNNRIGTVLRKLQDDQKYQVHIRGFPSTMIFSATDLSSPIYTKYEIKESPFHGRGVFATTAIAPGEIILRESQLIPFIPESEIANSLESFDVEEKVTSRADQYLISRITGGKLHSKKLSEYSNDDHVVEQLTALELRQVLKFNQFFVVGLCFVASHFNHSCVPNAAFEPDDENFERDDDQGLVFYAIKDIKPGEEILVSYSTLKNRGPAYFQKFGFECKCPLCSMENEQEKKLLEEKIQKIFTLKESYLLPEKRNQAELIAESAIALCDELLQKFDIRQLLRIRTAILGEMFQLFAQVDYFNSKQQQQQKGGKQVTTPQPKWYERANKWLTRFLLEFAKGGASKGAPTAKFVRIYQIHTHFLKQPEEFGDLIENQSFSQIMAGNYQ